MVRCLFKAFFDQKFKRMSTARAMTLALAIVPMAASARLYQDASATTATVVRDPARQASTEIDAVVNNPAGTAFLNEGLHLSVNGLLNFSQVDVGNIKNSDTQEAFNMIPSLQAAYKKNALTISLSYGNEGGNGNYSLAKDFVVGMGIEKALEKAFGVYKEAFSPIANSCNAGDQATSVLLSEGHLYNHTFRLGGAYQFNQHWAAYIGLRMNYYHEKRVAYTQQYITTANGSYMTADEYFNSVNNDFLIHSAAVGITATSIALLEQSLGIDASDLLDATQSYLEYSLGLSDYNKQCAATPSRVTVVDETSDGWGVSPVIGVHYQNRHLDVAAKYEFETKIHSGEDNRAFHIPSLLQAGVSWNPRQDFKAAVGFLWSHQSGKSVIGAEQKIDISNPDLFFNLGTGTVTGSSTVERPRTTINSFNIPVSVTFQPIKPLSFSVGYKYGWQAYTYRLLYPQSMSLCDNSPFHAISAGFSYDVSKGIQLNFGVSKMWQNSYYNSFFIAVNNHISTTAAAGINIKL